MDLPEDSVAAAVVAVDVDAVDPGDKVALADKDKAARVDRAATTVDAEDRVVSAAGDVAGVSDRRSVKIQASRSA